MPKGKGKTIQGDLDASADHSDNEPNFWSDEEEVSSESGSSQEIGKNVDVLKELIQHGFEVKGKLIDGKLSYIFRSPKTTAKAVVEEAPVKPLVRAQTMPTYVGGGAIHYHEQGGPSYPHGFDLPPAYANSPSIPDNRSVESEKKKKHRRSGWVRG